MCNKEVWRFSSTKQRSVVVVQNNGKGKTKKHAARANFLFANKKNLEKCAARAICFFY